MPAKKILITKINNDEWLGLCPFHNDTQPSLSVNLRKNVAICFAGCFQGTATKLIEKVLGFRPEKLEAVFVFTGAKVSGGKHLPMPPGVLLDRGREYMFKRGFTLDTLRKWQVGFDERMNRVAIPIRRRSGALLGYVYRAIDESMPRYLYSSGLKISSCLFGAQLFAPFPASRAYVVEGSLDCLWMHQCGFTNTVALLGSSLSAAQQRLLRRLADVVVLCLDSDQAGRMAIYKIAPRLIASGYKVYIPELCAGKKDVQEHGIVELEKVLREVEPFLLWRLKHSSV